MGVWDASLLYGACLLGIALVLSGCGGSGGGATPTPTPTPSSKRTTVLMMRHCARSMPEKGVYANPALEFFNNYSQKTWPAFNIPDFYCTKGGEEIVEQEGKWFKAHADLAMPVSFVADNVSRDNTTGHAFLRGLGLSAEDTPFVLSKGPFSWASGSAGCPKFTNQEMIDGIKEQMQKYPGNLSSFTQMAASMKKMAGIGAAGNWSFADCKIEEDTSQHPWAPVVGGCNVAAEFAERFLMESASGMPVAWNQLASDEIPKMLAVHSWYLTVIFNIPEIQRRKSASMAWAILEALEAGEQGTKAFVGHDTNQLGLQAILGLQWNPSPWPLNGTMPGSILRFDREDDSVTVSFAFVEDYTKGGDMKSVPAQLPGFPDGKIPLKALRDIVEKGSNSKCRTDKNTTLAAGHAGFVV